MSPEFYLGTYHGSYVDVETVLRHGSPVFLQLLPSGFFHLLHLPKHNSLVNTTRYRRHATFILLPSCYSLRPGSSSTGDDNGEASRAGPLCLQRKPLSWPGLLCERNMLIPASPTPVDRINRAMKYLRLTIHVTMTWDSTIWSLEIGVLIGVGQQTGGTTKGRLLVGSCTNKHLGPWTF